MNIKLKLLEEDFLNYQLYTASKSTRITKKRRKNWILVSLIVFGMGILSKIYGIDFLFNYFLLFGLITLIFYPMYSSREYKKHYKRYIQENYQNRIEQEDNLQFGKDYIESKSEIGEGKIKTEKIVEIIEIKDQIFMKIETGMSLILPKRELIDIDKVRVYLRELAQANGIEYREELNWKWR